MMSRKIYYSVILLISIGSIFSLVFYSIRHTRKSLYLDCNNSSLSITIPNYDPFVYNGIINPALNNETSAFTESLYLFRQEEHISPTSEGNRMIISSPLDGTKLLTLNEPLDVLMRNGIHTFLDRKISSSKKLRMRHWNRNMSSIAEYRKSVSLNRDHLSQIIGAVDERAVPEMNGVVGIKPMLIAQMPDYEIFEVSWPALKPIKDRMTSSVNKQSDWSSLEGPNQIRGEGLMLKPRRICHGYVIVLPDAGQTPEQLVGLSPGVDSEMQFVRRLVENGFGVICPVLLNRETNFSHGIKSNQRTHRDWIYTPAFEIGRHPIGYEVQKVIAAVDWLKKVNRSNMKVGVAGYGDGGQIAMYAAALDTRIDVALVSGYFGPRENMWEEPLYRNVWALLDEFGDAEIASLIAPRKLLVEYSLGPVWKRDVDNTGPGELSTPKFDEVDHEFRRIDSLLKLNRNFGARSLCSGEDGELLNFGSKKALNEFAKMMGVNLDMSLSTNLPQDSRYNFDPQLRQERMVKQMENHTQLILRNSEYVRDELILDKLSFESIEAYEESAKVLVKKFKNEHIGWLDEPLLMELNPRSRKIYETEKWVGYDVVIDVWEDVLAWGMICIPKDIKSGEKRPVVVCQHGLEGLPDHTVSASKEAFDGYKRFAAKLAEEGIITFAPHNLYRGENDFRSMQRKSNPIKASLFSIITPQHTQIINWLETLPYVDKNQIGFYGLSYGGKSAMRIPIIEHRYKLSICSGDFNEWVRINADIYFPTAYMYRGSEYEMPEWDLGHSFNYAEMTYLIAPRPFMVERGHSDGVGIDSWVAYEFARAQRVYDKLGISDDCKIEYFDGPHSINGLGTFEFLHEELGWPK